MNAFLTECLVIGVNWLASFGLQFLAMKLGWQENKLSRIHLQDPVHSYLKNLIQFWGKHIPFLNLLLPIFMMRSLDLSRFKGTNFHFSLFGWNTWTWLMGYIWEEIFLGNPECKGSLSFRQTFIYSQFPTTKWCKGEEGHPNWQSESFNKWQNPVRSPCQQPPGSMAVL